MVFSSALNAAVHRLNLTRGTTIAAPKFMAVRDSVHTLTVTLVRFRAPHDGQFLGDVRAQALRPTGPIMLHQC